MRIGSTESTLPVKIRFHFAEYWDWNCVRAIPKRKALPDNEIDLNFCEERLLFDQIIFYLKQITAK